MHAINSGCPLISVVIPFCNREDTLSYCIDSVLNANYYNLEVILVDDGSTDRSSAIGHEYSARDSRVHYHRQQNSGVSSARNTGLINASGEWITFIDSDDIILPNHFSIVANENKNADLLMTGATRMPLNMIDSIGTGTGKRIEKVLAKTYLMSEEFNPYSYPFYSVWDKFFKMSVINKHGLRFDETMSLGEDQVFVCDYLCTDCNLVRYTQPTYVCVNWDCSVVHLGGKLRSPQDYLYNQSKGYNSLKKLSKNIGSLYAEQYAVDFGVNRPISRILYNYSKKENKSLIDRQILLEFIRNQIVPFLKTVDVRSVSPRDLNIRITRWILLNLGAGNACTWASLWINRLSKVIMPLYYFNCRLFNFIKNRCESFT